MGNYRFRLSDMFPNAWFYKLRDMSRTTERRTAHSGGGGSSRKKAHHPSNTKPRAPPPLHSQSPMNPRRASYYIPSCGEHKFPSSPTNPKAFDTKYLVDPPRQSKKKHRVRRSTCLIKPSSNTVSSSVFSDCPSRTIVSEDSGRKDDEVGNESSIKDDLDGLPCFDKTVIASSNCRVTSSAVDIVIDIDDEKGRKPGRTTQGRDFYHLPPILTKPATIKEACSVPKSEKRSPRRRSSAGSHGLRIRANTPRMVSKKFQAHRSSRKPSALTPRSRWGISGSFVVVKSSSNPLRDFRDSMTEMIVENNIRAAADLEELLACYLSLNSNEYHNVIVKVFEQIWFDLFESKL